ncbi:hypothetical protein JCM8202_002996 [Rhodotorula sphaerocarpa]
MSKLVNLPVPKSAGYAPLDTPIKEHTVSAGGITERPIELGDLANDSYFDEVARIRDGIRATETVVTTLATKQALSLQAPSDALSLELSVLSSSLTERVSAYRARIAVLGEQVGRDEARRGHWENCKAALGRVVERWQRVERDHRERVRDKISRQMKIVNPQVTDEEILAAVDTSAGETTPPPVFQQALAGSRTAAARSALSEAQTRRSELLQIEETLAELAALMQQVADLVVAQDPSIRHLESTSESVAADLEKASSEIGAAHLSAVATRHKRKICAGVGLALVLTLAVVIAVEVKQSRT